MFVYTYLPFGYWRLLRFTLSLQNRAFGFNIILRYNLCALLNTVIVVWLSQCAKDADGLCVHGIPTFHLHLHYICIVILISFYSQAFEWYLNSIYMFRDLIDAYVVFMNALIRCLCMCLNKPSSGLWIASRKGFGPGLFVKHWYGRCL